MSDSYVCSGAMMQCTMGTKPAQLTVLPARTIYLAGQPQANISDHLSMVNLAPFGLCRSLAFPPTAAATAAALGTLTPMPCIHNTPAPWFVGKMDTLLQGQPALLKSCKCQCMWGGTISLITDGQVGEGTQYVQKVPKASLPHTQTQLIEPKTASHIWQPVNLKNKMTLTSPRVQAIGTTLPNPNELSTSDPKGINQQIPDCIDPRPIDTLILWNAYWEKDGMKIRFIPHQMELDCPLFLIFSFKNNTPEYNQKKAKFKLTFEIPDTIHTPSEKVFTITGSYILEHNNRLNEADRKEITNKTDVVFYYCEIEHFSSDLSKAKLKD